MIKLKKAARTYTTHQSPTHRPFSTANLTNKTRLFSLFGSGVVCLALVLKILGTTDIFVLHATLQVPFATDLITRCSYLVLTEDLQPILTRNRQSPHTRTRIFLRVICIYLVPGTRYWYILIYFFSFVRILPAADISSPMASGSTARPAFAGF